MLGPGIRCNKTGVQAKIADGDTPWVLGYNEPDETGADGGCNTSSEDAYNAWEIIYFYSPTMLLNWFCPAITSWDTTSGHKVAVLV